MTRVIIVRHGETYLNLDDVFQGWIDSKLTRKGLEQAKRVADRLKDEKIDFIYSSPFKRALKTAEVIRNGRQLQIIEDDRLKEIKCGMWEGSKFIYVRDKYPIEYGIWEKTPHLHRIRGGETFIDVYSRSTDLLKEVIRRYEGKTVLISSHMVTVLLMMTYFGGEGIDQLWNTAKQGNTAVNIVDIDSEGNFNIVCRGDVRHLQGMDFSYRFWEIGDTCKSTTNVK